MATASLTISTTDSDNDGYTDCEEGIRDGAATPSRSCPITPQQLTNEGDTNGLISWAEINGNDQGYTYPNGIVTVPNPDDGGSQLEDEISGNNQAAYREFLCGKANLTLTHMQWRIITFSCDTKDNNINDILGGTLGTYGTDWVMYMQSGTDQFEVSPTHKNTDKERLVSTANVHPGKGYWIIADLGGAGNETNLTIPFKTLAASHTACEPTSTVNASDTPKPDITDPDFTKVLEYLLPKE